MKKLYTLYSLKRLIHQSYVYSYSDRDKEVILGQQFKKIWFKYNFRKWGGVTNLQINPYDQKSVNRLQNVQVY